MENAVLQFLLNDPVGAFLSATPIVKFNLIVMVLFGVIFSTRSSSSSSAS